MTSLCGNYGPNKALSAGARAWLVLALTTVALSGCALFEPRSPELAVKERAQARWDALVKGDTKTAYSYLSPGSREVLSFEAYDASINKGFWKSVKVEKVECASSDSCEASGTMEYAFRGKRIGTSFHETWVRSGSQWWYLQK